MINISYELRKAAFEGNIIRVKLMLKLGADVNAWNNEALLGAAYYEHKDVCKVLIKHGASVKSTLTFMKITWVEEQYERVKKLLDEIQNI